MREKKKKKGETESTPTNNKPSASGDLLQPAFQSPILHRFGFGFGFPEGEGVRSSSRLATPLEIGVGGDGIIGRRVTVWRSGAADGSSGGFPVAEGIVGYN